MEANPDCKSFWPPLHSAQRFQSLVIAFISEAGRQKDLAWNRAEVRQIQLWESLRLRRITNVRMWLGSIQWLEGKYINYKPSLHVDFTHDQSCFAQLTWRLLSPLLKSTSTIVVHAVQNQLRDRTFSQTLRSSNKDKDLQEYVARKHPRLRLFEAAFPKVPEQVVIAAKCFGVSGLLGCGPTVCTRWGLFEGVLGGSRPWVETPTPRPYHWFCPQFRYGASCSLLCIRNITTSITIIYTVHIHTMHKQL